MQRIKVLIVEDEVIIAEEIKELLLKNGCEVVAQAEDAESALHSVKNEIIDIALLDININGSMDGIDLAKRILKDHRCAIIFLTAFSDEHFTRRAKEVKPAAYIVKPFEERNLIIAIEMAFNNLIADDSEMNSNAFFMTDYVFIKDSFRFKKVALESIHYVEAIGSYIDIHTDTGKFTLAINLKTFEQNLDHPI